MQLEIKTDVTLDMDAFLEKAFDEYGRNFILFLAEWINKNVIEEHRNELVQHINVER